MADEGDRDPVDRGEQGGTGSSGTEGPGDQEDSAQDLFEDLDKFFAPIDEGDWPELDHPEEEGSEAPPVQEPSTAGSTGEEMPSLETGPPSTTPGDAEVDESVTREPPSEKLAGEARAETPASTAEMSGEDWSRLRDVLGDDEEEDEEDFVSPPAGAEPPPEEVVYGLGGTIGEEAASPAGETPADLAEATVAGEPEPEEPHELTIDDLRNAPPEYQDLPGGEEGEGLDLGEREGEIGTGPTGESPIAAREEGAEEPVASGAAEEEADPFADVGEGALFGEDDIGDEPLVYTPPSRELPDPFAATPGEVEEDLLADLDRPATPRTVRVGEPEAMTGPTWEEPSSRALMGEPPQEPQPRSRDLPMAVLSAAVLGVVFLLALAWSPAAASIVAGLVVLLGQAELYATMHRRNYQPATALGLVLGALLLGAAYFKGEAGMMFVLSLGLVLCFFWYMSGAPKARAGSVGNIGATLLGLLYVPMLAGFILMILTQAPSGRALMLLVLILTFVYDISAFAIGTIYGSRPLAPNISPKKSWEGLMAATAVTIIAALVFVPTVIDYLPFGVKSVGLAIVICVFAPLGDLAESAIKRDLGVKDMGTIIPGHGGVLDRIDSLLFVAPAVFYFLRIIF